MKTKHVLLTGICAWLLAVTACKKPSESSVKDFAYKKDGKNFAIVAGYSASKADNVTFDAATWENLLARQQLGTFKTIYIEKTNTNVEALKAAFRKAGQEMDAESTLLFAFSGTGTDGKFSADQSFSYKDIATALGEGMKGKGDTFKAHRFYMLLETAVSGDASAAKETAKKHFEQIFADFNQAEKSKRLFTEALVFTSATAESTTAAAGSNNGRFSFEFSQALDRMIRQVRDGGSRPSLQVFFNSIISETNKNPNHSATYQLKPVGLKDESLFAADFVPPVEPQTTTTGTATPTTPVVAQPAPVTPVPATTQPAATAVAASLNFPLQSASGQTNLSQIFPAKNMLIEVSASWCGPCQNLAKQIQQAAQSSAAVKSGTCGHAALVVTDNNSSLSSWGQTLGADIASHSYQTTSSAQVNTWLASLGGQKVTIQFFPTLFMVDRSGQVLSVGSDVALSAFTAACP